MSLLTFFWNESEGLACSEGRAIDSRSRRAVAEDVFKIVAVPPNGILGVTGNGPAGEFIRNAVARQGVGRSTASLLSFIEKLQKPEYREDEPDGSGVSIGLLGREEGKITFHRFTLPAYKRERCPIPPDIGYGLWTFGINDAAIVAALTADGMMKFCKIPPEQAVRRGMLEAAKLCQYVNDNLRFLHLYADAPHAAGKMQFTSGGLVNLKNVVNVVGTATSPNTSSATYVVVPDLTFSITTNGGNILLTANVCVTNSSSGLNNTYFSFFRDGVAIGKEVVVGFPTASLDSVVALTFIDSPSAGSHTYDLRWKVTSGTATAISVDRQMQGVELG